MTDTYQEESFLGAGDLNIDVYDSDGNKTGEMDMGNATVFAIGAPSNEKKELTGFRRSNYATTIKEVITKSEQELKFTLTDINRENLKLAMFGSDADFTQIAGDNVASAESITAHLGKWSKLTKRNLDSESLPVVKDATDTTTYLIDDDYEVDLETGRIKALADGDISEDDILLVGATWLGISAGYQVTGRAVNKIEGFFRLIGEDQANSKNFEVIVYKATIETSGDINWLTDDFATLEFTGKILTTSDGTWDFIDLGTFA